jgi:predicted O-methyltransferase YrrM
MNEQLWSAVDTYITSHLHEPDAALDAALADSAAAGLPPIQVAPPAGKFLHLLARMSGARRILEIGTLGGYSAIWLARALAALPPSSGPAPRLITLEYDTHHANIAQKNVDRAGVASLVEIRRGTALDLLPDLQKEIAGGMPPFDFFFIDADKPNNKAYVEWAVRLARPGSVMLVDNVVRKGAILEPNSDDEDVQGTQRLYESVSANPRLTATVVQMVGGKGYDGMILAIVKN